MSLTVSQPQHHDKTYRYHLVRAAGERFQTPLEALEPEQRAAAEHQARQTLELESLVLSSPEARDTLIPEQRVEQALRQVRERFEGEADFAADLERNGLDPAGLRHALKRELIFDAVMTRVGAAVEPVTETDERLFYELHRERFAAPERRAARHILITLNDSYAENQRAAALARIASIAEQLDGSADRFGSLALKHSECPTAMQEGQLGTLPRGKLFPALDAVLFELDAGQISGVVESEMGFHLLLCERIEPAQTVSFEQARDRIRDTLLARRTRDRQKTWIGGLRARRAQSDLSQKAATSARPIEVTVQK